MMIARLAVLALCSAAITQPAWAEKPDFAGGHKPGWEQDDHPGRNGQENRLPRWSQPHEPGRQHDAGPQGDRYHRPAPPAPDSLRFGDRQREAVRGFYATRVQAGRCPPGLAKKANGCLPPGQAKRWVLGQALPHDVVRYPLPAELRRRLGTPPAGHEYVRVAGDILLLAIGTSLVVDAIEDLGGL